MGKLSGRRGPDPGQGGVPQKPIDIAVAKRAASIGCTNEEIAALMGISTSLLYEKLAEPRSELKRAIMEAKETGRTTLRRLQWQRANAGSDTMLIWLGKQLLGQREPKQEFDVNHNTPVTTASDADLLAIARRSGGMVAASEADKKRSNGMVH